ncbi:DUF305 domain-containing protein [Aquamicrobium sp. LC103]|uniref:CopM family metallochaperone n=1 Tax=Aquamicrobium sp. LC103 TaxID=1120658 RepID=UPI00063EC22A|nr:DUF305 domain-containing protein [Aquamicrobium sp. LC103]TKT69161.1 DUF305 domain-containing protein [Aquamicrobium sp. LC103]
MKINHIAATASLALALGIAVPSLAQTNHDGHGSMGHSMMEMGAPKGDQGPSSKAFAEANAKMHEGMDIEFTGNADADFVRGMIAHHQGAIDMARIELEFGKDPELRKLADEIISAQEAEIRMMQGWLEKNGG